MWFVVKYRGTTYNELKYRSVKKILESCYKPQFCFHIRTTKQRHKKTLTYTFHYWRAFC